MGDPRVTRMLVVADSDSYLKWAVARALEAPADWQTEVVVVRNAVTPSEAQRDAAIDGRIASPDVVSYDALVARLRAMPPAVLFLACRGPLIQLLLEESFEGVPPCAVSIAGIPGIWMPPTPKGLELRASVDMLVVHSEHERAIVAQQLPQGNLRDIGLASLIVPGTAAPVEADARPRVVFAPQALVPRTRADRERLLSGLAATARENPGVDVIIKLRGVEGEAQTHAEFASFPSLAAAVPAREWPTNLSFGYGPLREHLDGCIGFVTVSSTAALEAVAAGVPALCLDDFGVDEDTINVVFEGSGLFGTLEDLAALRFNLPRDHWMERNYFHAPEANDWVEVAKRLMCDPVRHPRSYRAPRRGLLGFAGRARRRHEALGSEDTRARRFAGAAARGATRMTRRVAELGGGQGLNRRVS